VRHRFLGASGYWVDRGSLKAYINIKLFFNQTLFRSLPHGETPQSVPALLLTGVGYSVGSLHGSLKGRDEDKLFYGWQVIFSQEKTVS
jgi:hypothetical protein